MSIATYSVAASLPAGLLLRKVGISCSHAIASGAPRTSIENLRTTAFVFFVAVYSVRKTVGCARYLTIAWLQQAREPATCRPAAPLVLCSCSVRAPHTISPQPNRLNAARERNIRNRFSRSYKLQRSVDIPHLLVICTPDMWSLYLPRQGKQNRYITWYRDRSVTALMFTRVCRSTT